MTTILPRDIAAMLKGYNREQNHVGCSSSKVYRYTNSDVTLYLKISPDLREARRECKILRWLAGKLPVPEVRIFTEERGLAHLLLTEVSGRMTCDCPEDTVAEPAEITVGMLADGLLMLQGIDKASCSFDNTLEVKLATALENIENGLVDMSDWNPDTDFSSPMELYRWLCENKPPEDITFTHGDYCLPNVFIGEKAVTGFVDFGRGGLADKWQDIALCVRSLRYNLGNIGETEKDKYIDLLFSRLGLQPDAEKIRYYILLDELF